MMIPNPLASGVDEPVLITGCPRSGTTWVGRMLASIPSFIHYHEPFNPDSPYHFQGALKYPLITPQSCDSLLTQQMQTVFSMTSVFGRLSRLIADLSNPKISPPIATLHHLPTQVSHSKYRPFIKHPISALLGKRILFKDPTALLSAEWLADIYGFKVVVLIRNPGAVVSSMLRCGWEFNVKDALENKSIFERFVLPSYGDRLESMAFSGFDLDSYVLQWNIFNYAVKTYQESRPDWLFLRYEDVCKKPLLCFEKITSYAGIKLTKKLRATIKASEMELSEGSDRQVSRDSVSWLEKWKTKLSSDEVNKVLDETSALRNYFYGNEDNHVPGF